MHKIASVAALVAVFVVSATAGLLVRTSPVHLASDSPGSPTGVLGSATPAGTASTAAGARSTLPVADVPASSPVSGATPPPGLPAAGCGATWPLPQAAKPPPPSSDIHRVVPVLTYHRIARPAEARGSLPHLVVSPALFAAQLRALVDAGWRSMTAAQLAADLATGRRPPRRSFVISIDDGWPDGAVNAAPVLRRLGLVATFYVITGRIGGPIQLSAGDVCNLARAGNEIGSHTVRHANLRYLGPHAMEIQLARSADTISSIVDRRPATFAYPFGGYDAAAMHEVMATGYAMAFTTRSGCVQSAGSRFAAPRLEVGPGTTPAALLAEVTSCAGD